MADLTGEAVGEPLRLGFDRRPTLRFRGAAITSDTGLLAYRELDGALGLTAAAGAALADARAGKDGRHALVGLLRQPVAKVEFLPPVGLDPLRGSSVTNFTGAPRPHRSRRMAPPLIGRSLIPHLPTEG